MATKEEVFDAYQFFRAQGYVGDTPVGLTIAWALTQGAALTAELAALKAHHDLVCDDREAIWHQRDEARSELAELKKAHPVRPSPLSEEEKLPLDEEEGSLRDSEV